MNPQTARIIQLIESERSKYVLLSPNWRLLSRIKRMIYEELTQIEKEQNESESKDETDNI